MKPLNGSKFRPLSIHAKAVLLRISKQEIPSTEINPGVIARLIGEGLVESVYKTSPYKTHKGNTCEHLKITEKGLSILI